MGYELLLPIEALRDAQNRPVAAPVRQSLMETVLSWVCHAAEQDRSAHLAQATGHEDLETRARQWDEAGQRALTMFVHRGW